MASNSAALGGRLQQVVRWNQPSQEIGNRVGQRASKRNPAIKRFVPNKCGISDVRCVVDRDRQRSSWSKIPIETDFVFRLDDNIWHRHVSRQGCQEIAHTPKSVDADEYAFDSTAFP